ncbi:MAG: hypothetical protein AAEJ57_08395, partial [Opitutales bacterium]
VTILTGFTTTPVITFNGFVITPQDESKMIIKPPKTPLKTRLNTSLQTNTLERLAQMIISRLVSS